MKKTSVRTFNPEEILEAVITYFVNVELESEYDGKITAKFVDYEEDDMPGIEIFLIEDSEEEQTIDPKNLN